MPIFFFFFFQKKEEKEIIQFEMEINDWAASINHVDKRGGRGFPKKPCLSIWGEGGVSCLSKWTKTFCDDPFFAHKLKKGCKKNLHVNEFLVCPFEQLYDGFLE